MSNTHVPIGVARAVLAEDVETLRFEAFAREFVAELEGGARIVGTSQSYDQGRDGRSVGPLGRIVVCATLGTELDDKARSDLAKVKSGRLTVTKAYFCTSQKLSEARIDELAASMIAEGGENLEVDLLSGPQLATLAADFPGPLRKHYASEIANCIAAMTEDVEDG